MKPGEVVAGRYRLDAQLGVGGMGEVWRTTHEATGREFAIKLMHAHAATSASARQRFSREARISATIAHPNVIDVFDAGQHDDGPLFLVMELLDGISLADALHLSPPLSVQDLLVVMHDTARALAAAHAARIIHRDIKPANIFLHRERGTGFAAAKVLDFGISKFGGLADSHHTKTGVVLGSPRYMSPEQTRSAASVDDRADIWSCGVILFEGLTGTWPHEGDSFSSLVVAICTLPPASIDAMAPEVPEPVRAVVRDCLQPVATRIQSAGELADRLAVVLGDPTLAQRPLARPLHPPSEVIRASSGVRIRPLLTTTGNSGGPDALASAPPPPSVGEGDELATTPIPAAFVAAARAHAGLAPPPPAPPPPSSLPPAPPSPPLADHDGGGRPQAPTMLLPDGAGGLPDLPPGELPPAAPGGSPPSPAPRSPDLLTGTLATLATTTVREPLASRAAPVPSAPVFGAPPSPPARIASGLGVVAAALSVLLVGIIVALVAVIRSGSGASPAVAAPTGSAAAAIEASPPPPVAPTPTSAAAPSVPASVSAPALLAPAPMPATSATSAPVEKARTSPSPAPRPTPGSRLKQLGSGL